MSVAPWRLAQRSARKTMIASAARARIASGRGARAGLDDHVEQRIELGYRRPRAVDGLQVVGRAQRHGESVRTRHGARGPLIAVATDLEDGEPDQDPIARARDGRADHLRVVDERAVRRAEVLHEQAAVDGRSRAWRRDACGSSRRRPSASRPISTGAVTGMSLPAPGPSTISMRISGHLRLATTGAEGDRRRVRRADR